MMSTSRKKERMSPASPPMKMADVLVSGGIDSAALMAFYLRQNFDLRALFVDFGQPASKQELNAARSLCKHYGVPLSILTAKCDTTFSPGEIPGRNAFLVFAAMLVCQGRPGLIAIGIHEGPPYYDCSEGFLNAVQAIVDGYAAGRIRIAAPFLKWNKLMVWEFCKESELPVDLTYSCEKGGSTPCRICPSCKDREALGVL